MKFPTGRIDWNNDIENPLDLAGRDDHGNSYTISTHADMVMVDINQEPIMDVFVDEAAAMVYCQDYHDQGHRPLHPACMINMRLEELRAA